MYSKRPYFTSKPKTPIQASLKLSEPISDDEPYIPNKSITQLVNEAIGPERWLEHLTNCLLKYWDKPQAKDLRNGLFPTYLTNDGINFQNIDWENIYNEPDSGVQALIDPAHNYVRAHSRQTYAYGIAFHMTGEAKWLELCRKGALALVDAMDGNYGMNMLQNVKTGCFEGIWYNRDCQDLAYGLTGLGMYYFLTRDQGVLHKIIQLKDFIFERYFDEERGYFLWFPRNITDDNNKIEIVAQLDQVYAYMLMLTPSLPEPYQTHWKKDLKKIADILIKQFYSQRYEFFWGEEDGLSSLTLGTEHTDFGHSVKTFWVILKIGEILDDMTYVNFARPHIDKILKIAYLEGGADMERNPGSWARRFDRNGELDKNKEWWILAELDQACEILAINDPTYLSFINNTHRYWFKYMEDKLNGEIWHMVRCSDNQPMMEFPKVHKWKTSLHSFEHALFGYMTSSLFKSKSFDVYYALPDWKIYTLGDIPVVPYMFQARITNVQPAQSDLASFMPDGNWVYKVTYDSLH